MTTPTQGKKPATFKEAYSRLVYALRNFSILKKSLKSGVLSNPLKERIMLAVTEVNGCALCSYGHTTYALEAGLNEAEIHQLLKGTFENVPQEEETALLFAQHVADQRGKISGKAWEQLVATYGPKKAQGILAAIQVIMMGNTYGMPFGSFMGRITKNPKFEKDPRSSLPYEIAIIFSLLLFIPLGLIHALIATICKRPKGKIV